MIIISEYDFNWIKTYLKSAYAYADEENSTALEDIANALNLLDEYEK